MSDSASLETALSFGDEQAGRIVLRGRDLAELAEACSYEEVATILWAGVVDGTPTRDAIGAARQAAFDQLASFEAHVRGRSAAAAMRLLLADFAAERGDAAVRAVAFVGVAAALATRSAAGDAWIAPDSARGHIEDLLAMATGRRPGPRTARAFERYCILMIDHGINASTHAARIVASTDGSLSGAMLAALATLQGLRHGGAPALVLDQFDAIDGVGDVARHVAETRAKGRRLMGFGSRAYRGRDLRSDMMQREWEAIGGASGPRADAVAIEAALTAELARTQPERGLSPNVEYYASLLLEATGLPRDAFTPMFAAARAAGWVAHFAEQRQRDKRIIRPISRYVGEAYPA